MRPISREKRGLAALACALIMVLGCLGLLWWRRRRKQREVGWTVSARRGPWPTGGPPLAPTPPSAAPADAPPDSLRWAYVLGDVLDGVIVFVLTTTLWLSFYAFGPALFGWEPKAVISNSMNPSIRAGDIVVVKPGPAPMLPGTLVTFHDRAQPGRVLTHRVIEARSDGTWTTKGDANQVADSTPVRAEDVIGQPRLVVPLIGLPAFWRLQGSVPVGAILGVLALAVLMASRRFVPRMPLPDLPKQVASTHVLGHLPAQRSREADPSDEDSPRPKEESWASVSASS